MGDLFTPDDLSGKLKKPKATLAQWRWRGEGPAFVKIGRDVRYRSEDVDAWLAANRHGGAADAPTA